jgi:hypothetical protein
MNMTALREEFHREFIGPEWLEAVRTVCRSVVAKYPPEIYAKTANWEDALDDLAQEVITNALIRDGQAQYLVDVCETADDFRRLLARQVAHVLARGRRRTVIDQLLARSKALLQSPPFEQVGDRLYTAPGAAETTSTSGYREAVAVVRAASRVPHRGTDRAPTVFTTPTLVAVLSGIVRAHGPITISDLSGILTAGLTPLLPSVLGHNDGSASEPSFPDPEDELHVQQAVTRTLDALTPEHVALLRWKLLGESDADVAARLHVSRPTAAAQKHEMITVVMTSLGDLPGALHDRAFDELTLRLCLPTLPPGYVQDEDA